MRKILTATTIIMIAVGLVYSYTQPQPKPLKRIPNPTTTANENTPEAGESSASERDLSGNNGLADRIAAAEENAPLPDWRSAFRNYDVPRKNLAQEVDNILESIENDSSGRPEMKLFRISDYCDRAAKNEEQLEHLKSLHEKSSLMTGQTNGETLENINRAVTHYNECKSLKDKGLLESYDYLEVAAAKGDPKAKTVLATLYEPKDFSSWSKSEKDKHRKQMEKGLKEARADCEPQAFYSIAHGVGENELWKDSSNTPKTIRQYSNLLARGMIYANKTKGAEQHLSSTQNTLGSIASNMTKREVAEAEKYGRYLYAQFCE